MNSGLKDFNNDGSALHRGEESESPDRITQFNNDSAESNQATTSLRFKSVPVVEELQTEDADQSGEEDEIEKIDASVNDQAQIQE